MPDSRDRLMHRRPIPISSNISLYSCSTDFAFDPISPFLIFVMCLSNKVVSKKVITKTATLKPVIKRCAARIVNPCEKTINPAIIKREIRRPANTCFDDPRTSLEIKYAKIAINVEEVNDTVFFFLYCLYINTIKFIKVTLKYKSFLLIQKQNLKYGSS